MSSSDFKTCLIQDDRIANLTDQITYAVMKGAQQVTSAQFKSTSASPSSMVFNVVVPSLETVVDRRVMLRATIKLKITGTVAVGSQLLNYGLRDALGPFPLHQLMNTMSVTINNNTVSMNTRDILPALMRYDQYLNYSDMVGANNKSFSGFSTVSDPYIQPRGAFPVDQITATDASPGAGLVVSLNNATVQEAYVTFTVAEPILLSPFIFGNPTSNNQGFYGIQNMSFNMTLGDTSRVWRHYGTVATSASIANVELIDVSNAYLDFTFLSVHASSQLSSRCVVPYYDMSRYISNFPGALIGPRAAIAGNQLGSKPTPGNRSYTSSTISLNQIPDKFIIYLRKPTRTYTDSDSYLPITKINISWNNNSGVCSSFSQLDLWRAIMEAGISMSSGVMCLNHLA